MKLGRIKRYVALFPLQRTPSTLRIRGFVFSVGCSVGYLGQSHLENLATSGNIFGHCDWEETQRFKFFIPQFYSKHKAPNLHFTLTDAQPVLVVVFNSLCKQGFCYKRH